MAAVAVWAHGPLPSKWLLCPRPPSLSANCCSPFPRCLRLIVHTLWPSPTAQRFFLLCVWIIRVPSHMLSSSLHSAPATNGYWVVSHWITTQYILLTSDIRLRCHHPWIMSLPYDLFSQDIVLFVSRKVLMLNTLCSSSITTTPDYNLFSCIFLFTSSPQRGAGRLRCEE